MDSLLKSKCEYFIEKRDELAGLFKRDGMEAHLMGAASVTSASGSVDAEDLKKCEDILKSKTGMMSSLRGMLKMPMLINMALSPDAESYYNKVERAYRCIKEKKGHGDERFYLAGMIIASAAAMDEEGEMEDLVDKTNRIYECTDTSKKLFEDMSCFITAALIATSGRIDSEAFAESYKACRNELELRSGIGKVPEDLCMLLAAEDGDASSKCRRVREIADALSEKKIKLGTGDAASMLAVLATLDMPPSEIAENVADASNYLKEQRGFGFMGVGSETRSVYACMLTCMAFSDESKAGEMASKAGLEDAIESRYLAHQNMLMQSNMMLQQNLIMTMMINTININNINNIIINQ